jgi:release factor glutamine methyltransferase
MKTDIQRGNPTVIEAVRLSEDYLKRRDIDSPRLSAELLLAGELECGRIDLYLRFADTLGDEVLRLYREKLRMRGNGYPLQYLLGKVEFYSLPFKVCEGVFIPRPETELLVEHASALFPSTGRIRFIEFGTGTGVISASLASIRPDWRGVALDISPAAASLASENFRALGVSSRIGLFVGRGFEAVVGRPGFDLLISNPPYIPSSEIGGLQPEVSRFENPVAIDGGEDGLSLYPGIAEAGTGLLRPGGAVVLEIGQGQAEPVAGILQRCGYSDIETMEDFNGIDRLVSARLPEAGEESDG